MGGKGQLWKGLLVGGALGLGLGILLAPEAGATTRRRLRGWAEDIDLATEDFLARTGQSAGEVWTAFVQGVRDLGGGFGRRFQEGRRRGSRLWSIGTEAAREARLALRGNPDTGSEG